MIVKDVCSRQGQIVFCKPTCGKTCNSLRHTSPHTLSSIAVFHLLPYLVCGQAFVDEAHFGEVLHPRCHTGQHIHQLHYTQLAFMFLRLWRKEKKRGDGKRKEEQGGGEQRGGGETS